MVMTTVDETFKKKEKDYSDYEFFFIFKIDLISFT